jgi:transcriptional regulator with XRE-family HTH domain
LTNVSTGIIIARVDNCFNPSRKDKMNFGAVLKNLRNTKGIGIKQLASELDLDYTYISKLENSKSIPSSKVIKRISKYFHYSSDELLLMVGKLPRDIEEILRNHPEEAAEYLRSKFATRQKR